MATVIEERAEKESWVPAYTLMLLFLANLLNIADRTLLGIVLDPVKRDLQLSDTEMSLVSGSAFVLFNLVVGIFIARWVDRGNRKLILMLGISLWSAATMLTGAAQGFLSLGVMRVLVGVGEATAFPVAISMIADLYAGPKRPRAIGIFQSSIFVGVVAGAIAAGMLAAAFGWRAMFMICGTAGFVLVALMWPTMREPVRGNNDEGHPSGEPESLLTGMGKVLRLPGFVLLSLGAGAGSMAGAALSGWAPTLLLRSHGVSLANVGALIGPTVGVGGVLGTLASGFLAGYFTRRYGNEIDGLRVPLIALPLGVPFYALFCFAESLVVTLAAAAAMNFLLSSMISPCLAAAVRMSPPASRAVSSTLMLAASGVIGGAFAPLMVGMVSDAMTPVAGADALRYGMASITLSPLVAWVLLWFAYRRAKPY